MKLVAAVEVWGFTSVVCRKIKHLISKLSEIVTLWSVVDLESVWRQILRELRTMETVLNHRVLIYEKLLWQGYSIDWLQAGRWEIIRYNRGHNYSKKEQKGREYNFKRKGSQIPFVMLDSSCCNSKHRISNRSIQLIVFKVESWLFAWFNRFLDFSIFSHML